MREANIYHAVHTGIMNLKFCGAYFNFFGFYSPLLGAKKTDKQSSD